MKNEHSGIFYLFLIFGSIVSYLITVTGAIIASLFTVALFIVSLPLMIIGVIFKIRQEDRENEDSFVNIDK